MSTIDAVYALIEEVTDNLDSKLKCSMVSLDLSKAFDTINHNILINKLSNIGIRGVCLKIMKSFLINRKPQVIFNNSRYIIIITYKNGSSPGFCSRTHVVYT